MSVCRAWRDALHCASTFPSSRLSCGWRLCRWGCGRGGRWRRRRPHAGHALPPRRPLRRWRTDKARRLPLRQLEVTPAYELERVFGIKLVNGAMSDAMAHLVQSHVPHEPESERVIAAQRETIAQQDATIRDLRARLNAEAEEERRKLIAILTERRPWWRRWLR